MLQPHTRIRRLTVNASRNDPLQITGKAAASTWPLLVEISEKVGSQCLLWEARAVPSPVPGGDVDQVPRQGL